MVKNDTYVPSTWTWSCGKESNKNKFHLDLSSFRKVGSETRRMHRRDSQMLTKMTRVDNEKRCYGIACV
jgi:hypothetical protein